MDDQCYWHELQRQFVSADKNISTLLPSIRAVKLIIEFMAQWLSLEMSVVEFAGLVVLWMREKPMCLSLTGVGAWSRFL